MRDDGGGGVVDDDVGVSLLVLVLDSMLVLLMFLWLSVYLCSSLCLPPSILSIPHPPLLVPFGTPFEQAANLSPVCVSRRLLSAEAYRHLALARQGGDPEQAGLTFVAEEDEEEEGVAGEGGGPDGAWTGVGEEEGAGQAADAEGEGASAGNFVVFVQGISVFLGPRRIGDKKA